MGGGEGDEHFFFGETTLIFVHLNVMAASSKQTDIIYYNNSTDKL